jgi:citronellol/citronellal dehydrogenase
MSLRRRVGAARVPDPNAVEEPMPSRLKDRVAIITGASRGVGRACALALAAEGCNVVIAAKTVTPNPKLPGTIHTVAEEIAAAHPDVKTLPIQCNVRHEEQIEAMVEETMRTFGRVDILVNNAGAAWWYPVSETPARKFDLVMEVNFRASHIAARAVLPHMEQAGFGHILNMSPPLVKPSMSAGKCAYMVSKFGMTYLASAITEEYADKNIAAHALWPVTLIESYATINLGLGERENWRKADILADATVELVAREPSAGSGRAWMDEEVLSELAGVTDFSKYACVPGVEPMKIPW